MKRHEPAAILSLGLLACRPTSPTPPPSGDSAILDASAAAPPSALAAPPPDAGGLTPMVRGLRGDCVGDAGAPRPTPVHLSAWLEAHHAHFPPDKSCWGTPPGGGPRQNLCQCLGEVQIPGGEPLLVCSRQHEEPAYGWSSNTVLYVVEKGSLRAVLDTPTGMSGNNFELVIPAIQFYPVIRGDTLVFTEGSCKACPVALETLASSASDPTWKRAQPDYERVCAVGSDAWKWSGRSLIKSSGRASPGNPAPTSSLTR